MHVSVFVRVHHIHLDLDLGVINKGNGTYDVWRRGGTANTPSERLAHALRQRERINEPEACKYAIHVYMHACMRVSGIPHTSVYR